ncbi:hypothetical protein GU926_06110 [Nibribacter ruber]|uniref:Uncharacterized protein n=1 Tax=Nibribacter ruber TaxID=2698458 RepID=A0A6P1NYX7_9BACT|nr:DUF6687 family protein [Nibribacter ruber]QHL87031.1 hypothetical protein GU926_06110 [Nibribacter ruber]
MEFRYLPFPELKHTPAVVVDSFHPNGLVLSHWRGAATPVLLREDTSAGMVLQALKQAWPALQNYHYVTANHFDIDALVGVWALLHPDLTLEQEETLRQIAVIGDFRELDLSIAEADTALKVVCWVNAQEKALFYPPFGADALEENEVIASIPKFHYFLEAFTEVLVHPERFKAIWLPEYAQVVQHYQQVREPATSVHPYPELGLVVIDTPVPVHYYALFSLTTGFDLVLSCYAGQRYELECKYTTWVDLATRPTLPRPDLRKLAARLNTLETSGFTWHAPSPTDTGPLLRLENQQLRKAEQYANPTERRMYASSIPLEAFQNSVLAFLRESFAGVSAKQYWTWDEMKAHYKKISF